MENDIELTSANSKPLSLRLPSELRRRVDDALKQSRRSLNSEVIYLLDQSLKAGEQERAAIAKIEDVYAATLRIESRVNDVLAAVTKLLIKS